MKRLLAFLGIICFSIANMNLSSAQVVTNTPGYSANNFTNSVCMNVHMEYIGGEQYGNEPYVKALLQSLSISCIRDSLVQAPVIAPMLNDLAASNIFATLTAASGNSVQYINNLMSMFNNGVVQCLEGPNELNLTSDVNWVNDDIVEQRSMKQALQAINSSSICLIGPSTSNASSNNSYAQFGDLSFLEDYGNLHNYSNAYNPETSGTTGTGLANFGGYLYPSTQQAIANGQQASLSKNLVSTENGYCTLANNTICVSTSVQVDYLLRMLMQQFKFGIAKTYIYDLADENESFGGTTYGLIFLNGSQKPSLSALSGFRGILNDSAASSSPCAVPAYTTNGSTATFGLCYSDGSYALVLWNPTSEWNPNTKSPITVSPFNIHIFLSTGFTPSTTTLWTLNNSTGVWTSTVNPNITNLAIGTTPSILRFNGPATPSPLPSIPTAPPS